jgi:hypothetical protein
MEAPETSRSCSSGGKGVFPPRSSCRLRRTHLFVLGVLCWTPIFPAASAFSFERLRTIPSIVRPSSRRSDGTDVDDYNNEVTTSARRRALITTAASVLPLLGCKRPGLAESTFIIPAADSINLQVGLLETRVLENVLSPPPYGMEIPDVLYPAWFQGTWKVASKTASVEAPCGIALFGTNATYAAAQKEVGSTLAYTSRFVLPNGDSTDCVADREFNVKSIAKAAFGVNSVVDIPVATPNKLTAIVVAPASSGGAPSSLVQVDLFTVSRRQETVDATHFDCSEVVREIVSSVGSSSSSNTAPRVLKEVETTSLYTFDPAKNMVTCRQRSAVFLLPSQSNPLQLRMWELARGRPVDVRFYDVVYTTKQKRRPG